MTSIRIAKDFSKTPGARYRSDGLYSGQDFRERHLEPLFEDASDQTPIEIDLDGTEGYATSFLEEAFGGIAEKYGVDRALARFRFTSKEEPLLPDEIRGYIRNGDKRGQRR